MKVNRVSSSMGVIYEREHFVQFYGKDICLIQNLKSFVGAGIQAGDPCVVICTPLHRQELDDQLSLAGLPISSVGAYTWLDARATLNQFVVGENINRDEFRRVIRPVLETAVSAGKSMRAFGEMVALLWLDGKQAAAVRLEELWGELAGEFTLTLFCAYPLKSFVMNNQFDATSRQLQHLHTSTIAEPHSAN